MKGGVSTTEALAARVRQASIVTQSPRQRHPQQMMPNQQSKPACADGTECLDIKAGVRDGLL